MTMRTLSELQSLRNADERFLTHREEQILLRLQADEIVRLENLIRDVIVGKWSVTSLRESISDLQQNI